MMSRRPQNDAYKLKDIWEFSFSLKKINLTLKGHSRGSERSCFMIPELNIYFDAGVQSPYAAKHIFVTHCHSDHSRELPYLVFYASKNNNYLPVSYVPNGHKKLFTNYLLSSLYLAKGTSNISCPFIINGVEPNEEVSISNGRDKYIVKVYDLDHSVLTHGYGLFQTKKKLKLEYKNLKKEEIIKLKKNNIPITNLITIPLMAYLCDTTSKIFENPEILTFPYIIVECTFLYDHEKEIVRKHIHWIDIRDIISENKQCMFILIHFSMRYSKSEIKEFFSDKTTDNMYVWLN